MCRSPCGERGLKLQTKSANLDEYKSLPVRGAWVEIVVPTIKPCVTPSLPVRGAWVEMSRLRSRGLGSQSLPVRGAWVEMLYFQKML